MKTTLLQTLIGILVITSIPAIIGGAANALRDGKCDYYNIIAYHPAHIIVCELFEPRWEEEK